MRTRHLTLAATALATAVGLTAAATATAVAAPLGLGDRVFPTVGNPGYDVSHYTLALNYGGASPSEPVYGTTTIVATARARLTSLSLDFAGRAVGAVRIDDRPAGARRRDGKLILVPERPIPRGRRFDIVVSHVVAAPTHPGRSDASTAFMITPDGSVTAPQPVSAHRIYPCDDHPSDKASYTFHITAPSGVTAVANGRLTARTTTGARTSWTYEQREPMAPELTQLAVGSFTVLDRGTVDGVHLRDVVPTRLATVLGPQLELERSQLRYLQRRLGRYPFATYGSLVADVDVHGLALETQTLSLFDNTFFSPTASTGDRATTMLHELAHQWFGDDVSPATWSDLWLDEGHVTWYEMKYAARHGWLRSFMKRWLGTAKPRTMRAAMREIYRHAEQWRRQDGPVAVPKPASLFSAQVYEGGALVLYMLRERVGAATFERIERSWLRTYAGRSATTQQFIAIVTQISGTATGRLLQRWLYGRHMPRWACPGPARKTSNRAPVDRQRHP